MTTTNSIATQSIGTGANKGEGLFPQKVTIAATTTAYVITARITNGTDGYKQAQELRIWFTSSSFSITAAQAVTQLKSTARYLDIKPSPDSGDVRIKDSSLEPITGSYIYFWCDIPTVTTAQTLDVNLVQLP